MRLRHIECMSDPPATLPPPARLVYHTPRRDPAPYKVPWRSKYTPDVAERICDEVASGRTLERIAIEEPWAPSERQMRYWLNEHADFAAGYQAAVHMRAEKLAQNVLDVADDLTIDPEDRKIMITARQWLAGKLNSRMWGERKIVDQNVTATVRNVTQVDVSHLTLDEMLAAESALLKIIDGEVVRADTDFPERD
jgi:hypothetical protein